MLKVAVMQPYLFPYVGYFHLLDAVDIFVCFDDVNFIKKGWVNRNTILLDGKAHLWSLPLISKSQNRKINEHEILDPEQSQAQLLSMIESAYHKAPYFREVMPLIADVLNGRERLISQLARRSLENVCEYLSLDVVFHYSSALQKDLSAPAQNRIIEMVSSLGGEHYCNLPGGKTLYSKEVFAQAGIELSFIESDSIAYPQFNNPFVANLCIIDVLMFNSRKACKALMQQYKLV